MADNFLNERLEATKKAIIEYEEAESKLLGGAAEYTIDTGQDIQRVKRQDLPEIRKTIDSLYNTYSTLSIRCGGGAVNIVGPVC